MDIPLDRFWNKVELDAPDKCWRWVGAKTPRGYGNMGIRRKTYYAHRLSWIIHYGPIKKGAHICHHCDNPACVNPEHLFEGSPKQNHRDMLRKGRWRVRLLRIAPELRRLYFSGGYSIADLAGAYKISPKTVTQIINLGSGRYPKPIDEGLYQERRKEIVQQNLIKRSGRRKLDEGQVREIKSLAREGRTLKQIADIYNVSASTISLIKNGHRWKWVE